MLPLQEAHKRVHQFVGSGLPIVVTCAPLFTIKVRGCSRSWVGDVHWVGYVQQ